MINVTFNASCLSILLDTFLDHLDSWPILQFFDDSTLTSNQEPKINDIAHQRYLRKPNIETNLGYASLERDCYSYLPPIVLARNEQTITGFKCITKTGS